MAAKWTNKQIKNLFSMSDMIVAETEATVKWGPNMTSTGSNCGFPGYGSKVSNHPRVFPNFETQGLTEGNIIEGNRENYKSKSYDTWKKQDLLKEIKARDIKKPKDATKNCHLAELLKTNDKERQSAKIEGMVVSKDEELVVDNDDDDNDDEYNLGIGSQYDGILNENESVVDNNDNDDECNLGIRSQYDGILKENNGDNDSGIFNYPGLSYNSIDDNDSNSNKNNSNDNVTHIKNSNKTGKKGILKTINVQKNNNDPSTKKSNATKAVFLRPEYSRLKKFLCNFSKVSKCDDKMTTINSTIDTSCKTTSSTSDKRIDNKQRKRNNEKSANSNNNKIVRSGENSLNNSPIKATKKAKHAW
jgi:hypothetical protein